MPLRILLADDHVIVRQGFKLLLEQSGFSVVGEAADGREAVRLAAESRPDVALIDLAMPMLNGLDTCREISKVSPGTRTILLTMYSEEQYILEALRAGVTGYLLKAKASNDLEQAIREVSRGAVYLSPGISRNVVQAYLNSGEPMTDPLSPREREVLQLVAEGKTTKEIASLLGISVKTVESHRTRIMAKLNIHETAGLVRYAIRQGLIQA
ncbi:MAG TPA: response regulator transcription factor [Candidatus Polarisedimenticolia bacterium]|nr:response regulator transcription factor [Candidatus Polarisedimenticolia bacterium]